MTAPDPRLEEIESRLRWAETYSCPTFLITTTHVSYLLAELRKAQDKLARVEGLAATWAGLGSERGYSERMRRLRAAVADATGGAE